MKRGTVRFEMFYITQAYSPLISIYNQIYFNYIVSI